MRTIFKALFTAETVAIWVLVLGWGSLALLMAINAGIDGVAALNADHIVDHVQTVTDGGPSPYGPRCPNRFTTTFYKSGRTVERKWCT